MRLNTTSVSALASILALVVGCDETLPSGAHAAAEETAVQAGDAGTEGGGKTGAAPEPNGAGDAGMEAGESDVSETESVPALPPIEFGRTGALVAPQVGQLLSVSVDHDDERGNVLEAVRFLGYGECGGEACLETETISARSLDALEVSKIRERLDAIPEGDCFEEHLLVCDPAVFTFILVDGDRFPFGGCVFELCAGYTGAVSRLANLMERLATPD